MKIVIRPGIVNPHVFVVHPVSDDYDDIGAFDKVNLQNSEAYQAFLALAELPLDKLNTELKYVEDRILSLSIGIGIELPKGSLVEKIIPKECSSERSEGRWRARHKISVNEQKWYHNIINGKELENLLAVGKHLQRRAAGDSSIQLEDWIQNPPHYMRGETDKDGGLPPR